MKRGPGPKLEPVDTKKVKSCSCSTCGLEMKKPDLQRASCVGSKIYCANCVDFTNADDVPHTLESLEALKVRKPAGFKVVMTQRDAWLAVRADAAHKVDFKQEGVEEIEYITFEIPEEAKFRNKELLKDKFGKEKLAEMNLDYVKAKSGKQGEVIGILMEPTRGQSSTSANAAGTTLADDMTDLHITVKYGTTYLRKRPLLTPARHWYQQQAQALLDQIAEDQIRTFGTMDLKKYKAKKPKPPQMYTDTVLEQLRDGGKKRKKGVLAEMAGEAGAEADSDDSNDGSSSDASEAPAPPAAAVEGGGATELEAEWGAAAPSAPAAPAAGEPAGLRRRSVSAAASVCSAQTAAGVFASPPSGLAALTGRPLQQGLESSSPNAQVSPGSGRSIAAPIATPATLARKKSRCPSVVPVASAAHAPSSERVRPPAHWISMLSSTSGWKKARLTREIDWASDCADKIEGEQPLVVALVVHLLESQTDFLRPPQSNSMRDARLPPAF